MRNVTILIVLSLLVIIPFLGQTVIGGNNCSGRTFLQSNKTLSRKKRYLAFPTGSAFVTTITLLKAIQLKEPSNWNLDLEFDMIWPIPNQETLYKRPSKHTVQRTRRHKRDLYANIELALANQGLPAKKCVLRMICEARLYLSPPGASFLSDLLRVVLSHEDAGRELDKYDIAYRRRNDCDIEYPCPISILKLLFSHDQQFFR